MKSEKSSKMSKQDLKPKKEDSNYFAGREIEFFKVLDSSLDVAVSILDENMIYQYISKSVYEELGFSTDEIGPGDSLSRCHELMIEKGLLNDEILFRNQLAASQKEEHLNSVINSKFNTVELANGTVQRFVRKELPNGHIISMATDITDIVEQERILESSLILGKSGYWIYDFKTKTHKISDSIEGFVSKDVFDQIRKQGIVALIHHDDRDLFRTAIRNLTNTKGEFEFTARIIGNDPSIERACLFTGVAVKNKAGEWFKLRTFIKDVSRERQQSLELERAKDEALAASQAKSQFLANMSHEIRTPMNGVLGMAELLSGTDITDRQREFLNVIMQSSSALLNIINDILDFSKIEAGALTLDPMPLDMREVINSVARLLNTNNKNNDVELVVNYPSGLPSNFIGDAGRLRQILTNLVGNALKFTKKGHVIIDVHIRTVRGSHAIVNIDVRDTGIGIDEDKIKAVFNKFTQADGSTTRLYGGTGLGLSICKHLVEMMNGRMDVKSKVGEGSTFGFKIPLEIDKTAKIETFDIQKLCCRRVLIVDDIEVNRFILSERCKAWSMISDSAENGIEAIEKIKIAEENNTPYDVILLDFLMPGMNGIEFAQLVKDRYTTNPYTVIMLSSVDQASTTPELKVMGVDTYLTKPVPEKTLFKALQETFAEKSTLSEPKSVNLDAAKTALHASASHPSPLIPKASDAPTATVAITDAGRIEPTPQAVQRPELINPTVSAEAQNATSANPSDFLEMAFNDFEDAVLSPSDTDIIEAMDLELNKSIEKVKMFAPKPQAPIQAPSEPNSVPKSVPKSVSPEVSADINSENTDKNSENSDDKIHILVAEDFALNQDVIRLMLSDTKFVPTFANNGKEAYEEYCQNHAKYSVVVMDVSMPVMDGYESTKQIQIFERKQELPLTPIIALTGHALSHDRQLCIDAGMDDYMTKPVKKSTLMERLNHYSGVLRDTAMPEAVSA